MNRFKNKFLSVMLSAAMVAGMLSPMGVQAKAISSGDEYLTTADGQKVKITVQYGGTSETIGVLEGDMATVVDGNAETGVNFRGNASGYADDGIQVGDYIQVEYEEAITLENAVFTFKSGSTDIFQKSTFSYSLDGTEWVDAATIESSTVMIYKAAEAIEGVKAIRLTNDEYIRKWLNLNEISVNQDLPYIWNSTESKLGYEKVSGTATAPSAASEELEGPGNGIVAAATDESKNTFWHSSYSNDETDLRNGGGTAASEYSYIEVALAEATDLAGVTYMPRQLSGYDYSNGAFKTFKVQVKTADGEWTDADIASINGNEVTTADFSGTDLEGNEVTAAGPYVTVDYAEKQPNEELEVFFKDVQKDITAVKFVVKESFGTSDTQYNQFLNAAEISGLKAKAEEPEFDIEVSDRVKDMIVNMSLRDKVTQMLMVDFRMWDTDTTDTVARTDFTVMNDQVRKIVEDYNFGSVIYFANNIKTTEDTFALTQEMQAAATKDGGIALLIAADQEGGSVYRLGSGTALPGNMALGATFNTDNAYKAGKIIGSELGILGINTNLAPVVDVNNNANNPVIGLRSYGDDATAVGEMAAASIAGMAEYNVIGTAKHFPGHGDTATDSHYGLPMVDKSLDVLKEVELKPYEVAIEEGIEMIMTAHILYPQLESDKIVSKKTGEAESLPATMSDDILTGLLKEDMGFDGIIVTDAMNMAGISDKWDQVQSVVIAFQAGVDMICMPCQLYSMDDLANLDAIIDGVVAAAEAGEIPMSRIDSAVARILNVKENRGILDYKAEDYTLEAAKATVGSAENRQTEREIAAAAVTVVKNENNVLPLDIKEDTNVLMLVPYINERSQMLMAWNRAKEAGLIPEGAEVDYYTFSRYTTMETADFAEKLAWANIVIINSEISSAAKMAGANTTAALTSTTFLAAIPTWVTDYCKENGKISVISSVDKPYDVQLYPNADAIVAAYGCKGSSVDPTEALIGGVTGSEAAYGPNIIAAVEVALGTFPAQGKLPVTIPVFDAATKTYTEEVAFERGYGLTYDAKEPLPEVEPVDKSGLETMVADAKAGDYSSKTEESVAALNAAIEAAEAVLANEAATQEEVDAAKAALVAAVLGLQDKPVEPEKPVADKLTVIKATAGNAEGAEPAERAIDGDTATTWHTDWYPEDGNTHEDHWLQVELDDVYAVSKYVYLPRQTGNNGIITSYKILVSLDGEEFTEAAAGEWALDAAEKTAEFEAVNAKYVRLQTVEAYSDQDTDGNGKKFASAAEVSVYGTAAIEEPPVVEPVDKSGLETMVADAKAGDYSSKTEESVAALNAAIEAAEAVLANEAATQEEVDEAKAALVAAVIGLQDKPVEPDVTDPADASKDVPTDMYTATAGSTQPGNSPNTALDENPGSFWEVVWDIGDTDPSVMWYQIELADEVEIDAVRYLPRWGGDAGNINGFVTQYLIQVSTDGENWTDAAEGTWERTEGWKIAEFEAVTAKYVRLTGVGTWADVGENSNMSIAEIRVRATGEVINKGALKAAIAKAENLVKEDYVDLSGIEAPLAAAKAVADKAEATQEEVDAAAAALNEALDALVKVVKKDALKAEIADAKAVDQSLYTSKTAKALANAIEAGEDLVDDETATQEVVDAATAAITKAKAALVAKATAEEKAALAEAVEAAEAMDTSAYTEESVAALDEAIAAAKAVLDDADATSKDVKDAADDLQDAVDALEIPVVEDEVVRLFGQGRYDTAYAVADALKEALGVEKFEAVVVATGKNFADALAGSYLAVEKNAPILLTNGNDENVAQLHAYIKANVAEGGKVYILGGDGAVPTTVDVIDGYEVERLFGDSRYDTNLAIIEEAGVTGDSVIVATGKTFADSLSASAAKLPILLVKPDGTLNDAQKAILTGMKNIYVVGGDGAVSTGYEAELKEFGEVTRVFGESRYDTSVEVAKTFCKDVTKAVVASGKNFPDGLCGGPLAAALNAPLVLTKDGGTDAAAVYVAENGIAGGYVLGGDGALTDATVVEVFALTGAEEIK